ncbi:4-hydroxyphenylpyruvate dioxygenase, partial [candidate division KSB1 bacterium]|nr:4-hydroxyphenylpyruvate dioxygenase [candidate division KSB1 bacterium]
MHIDMCYGGVPSKVPENSMGIRGYDFVEFYVGSAKMIAYWHAKAMGCDIIGYRGPETGVRDRISYLLKSHKFRIIITSALQPGTHEINSFTVKHGDGFKRWSLEVTDVKETFEKAVKNGGIPVNYPCKLEDEDGFVEEAAIRLYDDTEIVFTN